MMVKVKARFEENEKNKQIVKKVFNHPYIELNDVLVDVDDTDEKEFTSLLERLIDDLILIELTSQAGSSIESRIPKRLLIVNPQIEKSLENIFK